jgi:hypothetical protein
MHTARPWQNLVAWALLTHCTHAVEQPTDSISMKSAMDETDRPERCYTKHSLNMHKTHSKTVWLLILQTEPTKRRTPSCGCAATLQAGSGQQQQAVPPPTPAKPCRSQQQRTACSAWHLQQIAMPRLRGTTQAAGSTRLGRTRHQSCTLHPLSPLHPSCLITGGKKAPADSDAPPYTQHQLCKMCRHMRTLASQQLCP